MITDETLISNGYKFYPSVPKDWHDGLYQKAIVRDGELLFYLDAYKYFWPVQ